MGERCGSCHASPAYRFSLSSWKIGDVTRVFGVQGWNRLVSNKKASSPLSCSQQLSQHCRLLQEEEEEDRDELGNSSGTAHPGAAVALTSQPLPCESYCEQKTE